MTADYQKGLSVCAILLIYKLYKDVLPLISPVKWAEFDIQISTPCGWPDSYS